MSVLILTSAITIAQAMLALAIILNFVRLVHGPRAQDRLLGLDSIYANATLMALTIGMRAGTTLYFEAALIIAVIGFVSSSAFAKFLMRGEVIE